MGHSAAPTVIPINAVSERRYMRILLGILIASTLLLWPVVFYTTNNAVAKRFFASHFDAVRFHYAGGQDNTSAGTSKQKHSSRDNDFTDSAITDLPTNVTTVRPFKCLGWRATGGCSPSGPRRPQDDLNCSTSIPPHASGYCEVVDTKTNETFRVMKRTCSKTKGGAKLRCSDAPGFANFRAQAQVAVDRVQKSGFKLPNVGANDQGPKQGITMVVYPALVPSAYATIRVLRDVHNCQLPIEIWYSPDEMKKSPRALTTLQTLDQNHRAGILTLREIKTNGKPIRFEAKVYAIYHSNFDQVLFLDADNVPARNPTFLFETPEFQNMGAVFWPDYWHPKNTMFYINPDSLVWQLLDTPFVDMFEQESGQLLIDRRRHAAPLQLVAFYAFHQPNYFGLQKLAWGDKDLFRFAWLKLDAPFFMIQSPPAIAGMMIGSTFCGLTMVQHDTNGEVLFLHRNQRKLMGKTHPKIVEAAKKNSSLSEFESSPTDGYPDPHIWEYLLSFRNTSSLSKYVVSGDQGPAGFPKWQRCYGRLRPDKSPNFYVQNFSDLSFSGLEDHVREFAFEAEKLQKSK